MINHFTGHGLKDRTISWARGISGNLPLPVLSLKTGTFISLAAFTGHRGSLTEGPRYHPVGTQGKTEPCSVAATQRTDHQSLRLRPSFGVHKGCLLLRDEEARSWAWGLASHNVHGHWRSLNFHNDEEEGDSASGEAPAPL